MNNTLNYQEIISELKSIQETKKEFIYETRNYKINELYNYCQKFKYNIDLNLEINEYFIQIIKDYIFEYYYLNPKNHE